MSHNQARNGGCTVDWYAIPLLPRHQTPASWQMPILGHPLYCSTSMLPAGRYSERAGIGPSRFPPSHIFCGRVKRRRDPRGQAATLVQETAKRVLDNGSAVMITAYIRECTGKVVDGSREREWTLRTKKFIKADLKCGGREKGGALLEAVIEPIASTFRRSGLPLDAIRVNSRLLQPGFARCLLYRGAADFTPNANSGTWGRSRFFGQGRSICCTCEHKGVDLPQLSDISRLSEFIAG